MPDPVDLQRLVGGDVFAAQSWLQRAIGEFAGLPEDFNWHGFAEGAAQRARSSADHDGTEADSWATIATTIYDRLAVSSGDGFTFELSAMYLRVWMIARFGSVDGHPVRDRTRVTSWCLQGPTSMSFEEAELATRKLRQLPIERWSEEIDLVRSLRQLKNRLNVARGIEPSTPEIQRWLGLRDQLP